VQSESAVTLRIPADPAYVSLVRVAVAAMCARLDFTVDRIEDIKLAVTEAAALLLGETGPGRELDFRLTPDPQEGLRIEMAGASRTGSAVSRDGFTWLVLTALVDEVIATVSADHMLTIALSAHRAEAQRP
jgi:serine/threonine-protein kinase RsbW